MSRGMVGMVVIPQGAVGHVSDPTVLRTTNRFGSLRQANDKTSEGVNQYSCLGTRVYALDAAA